MGLLEGIIDDEENKLKLKRKWRGTYAVHGLFFGVKMVGWALA